MAVIGILTCEVLEQEFARLLGDDVDLKRITVLEDRYSARLIELLEARAVGGLQRIPHLNAFRPEPDQGLEVLVRVLPMGLHRTRQVLRKALTDAAHALRPHVDALMLGYGLCGNALEDPRAVLDVDLPLFLPMDDGHPVDDCVALCLGGRDRYYGEQCKVAGTYFLTPGWSRHWKRMLDGPSGKSGQPTMSRVLSGYERALLVQTPALADEELERRGEEFVRASGLRLERCRGSTDLLTSAWNAAKKALTAPGARVKEALP
ncbi:MAG TPA: DUF1638 domain-containing protein [Rhodocyclaceae bacterium]|nr:DUF1638 domain-containing protein [Rhodocyclaceae bacterium]